MAGTSHSPVRWQLAASELRARGHVARQQKMPPGLPLQPPCLYALLPSRSWNENDLWPWQTDFNILTIFWINTWVHFPKWCFLLTLPLFTVLINWGLLALKSESNESNCPHFWALMCIYISVFSPHQHPPVDVLGTAVATMHRGWEGGRAEGNLLAQR